MKSLKSKLFIGLAFTITIIGFIILSLIRQYENTMNKYEDLTDNIAYIEEVVFVTSEIQDQLIMLYSDYDYEMIEPIKTQLLELSAILNILESKINQVDSLYLFKRFKISCEAFDYRALNLISSMESNNIVDASNNREATSIINSTVKSIGLDLLTNELDHLQILKISLKKDSNIKKIQVLIFTLVMIIILTVALFKLNSNIIKSVNYIVNIFREIGAGNLNMNIQPLKNKDEFKYIADEALQMKTAISNLSSRNERSKNALIVAIGSLAEMRDDETGKHIHDIQDYLVILCDYLVRNTHYKAILTEQYIETFIQVAPLHDIGKVGIPDAILQKPGKLTFDEFEVMKRHVEYGVRVIENAKHIYQEEDTLYIELSRLVIAHHHERWDGTGYPEGLSRERISLVGRIMALADVYEALSKKRVYKDAFSHEVAVEIISSGRGTHFDPVIVDAFLSCESEFEKIRNSKLVTN